MTLFPQSFVTALVYGAIAITAAGATGLVVLLVRDWKDGKLW
jgi:hypothetical protein